MKASDFSLTVLGSRGSMAFCGSLTSRYGGDSSCYMVRAGEETIFLDAGTGIAAAPADCPRPPVVLLSHLHLDHIVGLGVFPCLLHKGWHTRIFVPFCADRQSAEAALEYVFSPPYWPLRLTEYAGHPRLLPLPDRLTLGEVSVDAIPGNHPGGCMVYRLTYHGKTIVYATDYEYEPKSFERLIAFSRDVDLLLFDSQYTEPELLKKAGFGHASAEKGLELMRCSGAKRLLLIHHDPQSLDHILALRERAFTGKKVELARTGQCIEL